MKQLVRAVTVVSILTAASHAGAHIALKSPIARTTDQAGRTAAGAAGGLAFSVIAIALLARRRRVR